VTMSVSKKRSSPSARRKRRASRWSPAGVRLRRTRTGRWATCPVVAEARRRRRGCRFQLRPWHRRLREDLRAQPAPDCRRSGMARQFTAPPRRNSRATCPP
jgi:hypothetical protein